MALTKFKPADVVEDDTAKEKVSTSNENKVETKVEVKDEKKSDKKTDSNPNPKEVKVAKPFRGAVKQHQEAVKELDEAKKVVAGNAYTGGIAADAIDTLTKKAQPVVYQHHKKDKVVKLGISLPYSTFLKIKKYSARQHDKISRVIAGMIEAMIPQDLADKLGITNDGGNK